MVVIIQVCCQSFADGLRAGKKKVIFPSYWRLAKQFLVHHHSFNYFRSKQVSPLPVLASGRTQFSTLVDDPEDDRESFASVADHPEDDRES